MKAAADWSVCEESSDWDRFVQANRGSPYQTWAWRTILEECGNDPEYLAYRASGGTILAVCPLFRVRDRRTRLRLTGPMVVERVAAAQEPVSSKAIRGIIPLPSLFGPDVDLPRAAGGLLAFLKHFRIPALRSLELMTFQPTVIESFNRVGLANRKVTDVFETDLHKTTIESIWGNTFGKHDRQDIKYFDALGVQFRLSSEAEDFTRFLRLHESTMSREGFPAITEEYLSLMRRHLGPKLRLALYLQSEELVAGQLLLIDQANQAIYIDKIGYSRSKNIRSSVVSLWFKICVWATQNGYRYINFGGGWSEAGYRLKGKFGGNLLGNYVFTVPNTGRLYSLGASLTRKLGKAEGRNGLKASV